MFSNGRKACSQRWGLENLLLLPTRIALSKNVNGRLIVFQVLRKSAFIALDVDAIPVEIPLVLRDRIAVWFNDVEGKDCLSHSSLISEKKENKDLLSTYSLEIFFSK